MPWPPLIQAEIETALLDSAGATYGSLSEMMVDLNLRMVADEILACGADCEWGAVWYSVPQAVADPVGTITAGLFDGSIRVISDTGEASEYPITARRSESWVPIGGYLAADPTAGALAGR